MCAKDTWQAVHRITHVCVLRGLSLWHTCTAVPSGCWARGRSARARDTCDTTYRHVRPGVAPHVALHRLLEQLRAANVGDQQRVRQAPGLEAGVDGAVVVAHKDGLLDLLLLQPWATHRHTGQREDTTAGLLCVDVCRDRERTHTKMSYDTHTHTASQSPVQDTLNKGVQPAVQGLRPHACLLPASPKAKQLPFLPQGKDRCQPDHATGGCLHAAMWPPPQQQTRSRRPHCRMQTNTKPSSCPRSSHGFFQARQQAHQLTRSAPSGMWLGSTPIGVDGSPVMPFAAAPPRLLARRLGSSPPADMPLGV